MTQAYKRDDKKNERRVPRSPRSVPEALIIVVLGLLIGALAAGVFRFIPYEHQGAPPLLAALGHQGIERLR